MAMSFLKKLSKWYGRNYVTAIGVSLALFALQLIHLFWLTTDVVSARIFGYSLFHPTGLWQVAIVIVDYLEIPTLISVSIIYLKDFYTHQKWQSIFFLLLLNSQWLHMFWITDEVVEEIFTGSHTTILPEWAAWIAILIDYLEVPVIIDLLIRFVRAIRLNRVKSFLRKEFASK